MTTTEHVVTDRIMKPAVPSSWSPFRHPAFTVLWIATVISNVGAWMYNAGSGWLMTALNPDPFTVALVQVATSLPMFALALPAGALADILDRRKFLIGTQIVMLIVSAALGVLVVADLVTPWVLLLFTLLAGAGAALTAPAWQAVVPQLVPRADLQPAVALNSIGVNISRAVGPALAGIIIAVAGLSSPFFLNAASFVVVILALLWWRPPPASTSSLPAEHFNGAIRVGIRHARRNRHLRATLVRAVGFFFFASAYWALLPLVAREQIDGGPELYGLLLGAIGASAVAGALALSRLKAWLGADRLVAAGAVGTAVAMLLFGLARDPVTGFAASIVAGVSWIAVLATLNVSAQVALPDWVRARGLAVFVTVFFGAMTAGSLAWGQVAGTLGLDSAHFIAAAGLFLIVPLTWRWKLQTGAGVDMSPSMHWPAPILAGEVENDRGPVMVTVEYRIDPTKAADFAATMDGLASERQRDGAYAWGLFEDAAEPGRWLEYFLVDSWLEHLRQHERVTASDQDVQDKARAFHIGTEPPAVRHLIAPEPSHASARDAVR